MCMWGEREIEREIERWVVVQTTIQGETPTVPLAENLVEVDNHGRQAGDGHCGPIIGTECFVNFGA